MIEGGGVHGETGDRRLSARAPVGAARGFTLLEVLVVGGVVTLLLSILLPTLARSREQARAVKCRSNLRQWGAAMQMYASYHGGSLSFEERPDPRPDLDEPEDVIPPGGDRVWDGEGWVCWYDVMDRYLGEGAPDPDLKTCPTVRLSAPYSEESYRMNSKLADSSRHKRSGAPNPYFMPYRRLDTLQRPAETVVLFDGDVGGGKVDPQESQYPSPPSFKGRWRLSKRADSDGDDVNYRHNTGANILFADWHAEGLVKKVLEQQSYDWEKYRLGKPDPRGGIVWQPPDLGPWDPDPPGSPN